MCDQCRLVKFARVLPYHCQCGQLYWGDEAAQESRKACRQKLRTFAEILREIAGCGCAAMPWSEWDGRGLEWCCDHADEIARCLANEPRTKLSLDRSQELVQFAIRIASRSPKDRSINEN